MNKSRLHIEAWKSKFEYIKKFIAINDQIAFLLDQIAKIF